MHLLRVVTTLITLFISHLSASTPERKATSRLSVTSHVLTLTSVPLRHPILPSSKHLTKRYNPLTNISQEEPPDTPTETQQQLLTLAGKVYMTNVTLAGSPYTLVIDTGSSDTWIASSSFQCLSRISHALLPQASCNFGALYDVSSSRTFSRIPTQDFAVSYADGEFLSGQMGTEELGIGDLEARQVIGVVERGFWIGDGVSGGLMGLGYSGLARNVWGDYTSVVFSLFEDGTVPPVFCLALSRPTKENPVSGGLLAIGGILDIAHDHVWVSVPIRPIVRTVFAFYSIPVDGFIVTPPSLLRQSRSSPRQTKQLNQPANLTQPLEMIIDSGATNMYLPDDVADYIASLFLPPATYNSLSYLYTVSCSASAPRVGIIIAGQTFFVNPEDLVSHRYYSLGTRTGAGTCVLALQRNGAGNAVLGDAWLKNVIAVFDLGNNEMRFAARENY